MSLEQALEKNTEAVMKLVALLQAGQASVGKAEANEKAEKPAEEETTGTRRGRRKAEPATETKASKYTAEQVKAAAVKVKDALGSEAAKKLISDHGAPKLDQLKPEQYEAFIAAAEKLLSGDGDDDDGDDDDL